MSDAAALSLFSGLGGLDLGAAIAGLDIKLATDQDDDALRTLSAAQQTSTLTGDIDELLDGGLRAEWGSRANPRFMIGGPPCTAFSHAGFWVDGKRDGLDPAAELLSSYVRCLSEFEPEAWILENVPGLAFKTHERFLAQLIERAEAAGYAVSTAILSASDFGIAQARRRLFVVGTKTDEPVDLTCWPQFPARSSSWAIGELADKGTAEPDELTGAKYRDLLPLVPEGGNYLHFTDRRGWKPPLFKYRGRYWSFLLKLDPDRPSPTLPAQRITYNGPFHWENRHLRIREIARLQGIPDSYPLSKDLTTARRHLGNAVPPLLGAAVIWRVRQTLGDVGDDELPHALSVATDPDATWSDVQSAVASASRLTPAR